MLKLNKGMGGKEKKRPTLDEKENEAGDSCNHSNRERKKRNY